MGRTPFRDRVRQAHPGTPVKLAKDERGVAILGDGLEDADTVRRMIAHPKRERQDVLAGKS